MSADELRQLDDLIAGMQGHIVRSADRSAAAVPGSTDAPNLYQGTCAACGRAIVTAVVHALGRDWHVEHFCCAKCRCPLGAVFLRAPGGAEAWCDECWRATIKPCAGCSQDVVSGSAVEALGRRWHPQCFKCLGCSAVLDGGSDFYEHAGQGPYCAADYKALFGRTCAACGEQIAGQALQAMGRTWHVEHFVCSSCAAPLAGAQCFEYQGKPYCREHYVGSAVRGVCASCGQAITGQCLEADGKKYHPDHFVCSACKHPISGSYAERDGRVVCLGCRSASRGF
eukprot:m51a1_g12192 putative transforming growth factor beta-1-induced transcript 1 protein (283) ;mRNA; r:23521-25012